jgi:hypothetical protein
MSESLTLAVLAIHADIGQASSLNAGYDAIPAVERGADEHWLLGPN